MDILLEWASRLPWHHPLRLSTLKLALCTKESMEKYARQLEEIREYERQRRCVHVWGMHAIHRRDVNGVTLALECGLDVHGRDEHGCTPLHHACMCIIQSISILEKLLDAGADVNACVTGDTDTALSTLLLRHRDMDPIRFLLKRGADPNGMALYWATTHAPPVFLRELITAGADITRYDDAINHAVQYGTVEHIRILLDHGADVHFNSSLLHLAVERGNEEIVRRVLAAGAGVHDKTALDRARERGRGPSLENQEYHRIATLLETARPLM